MRLVVLFTISNRLILTGHRHVLPNAHYKRHNLANRGYAADLQQGRLPSTADVLGESDASDHNACVGSAVGDSLVRFPVLVRLDYHLQHARPDHVQEK